MLKPFAVAALLALMICPLPAQEATDAPPATPAPTAEKRPDEALAFLEKVEQKNEQTTALTAEFRQLRIDRIFDEKVESQGRFWYKEPGKYRASYTSENDSEIWIVEGKLINYVPSLRQVEIIPQATGDDAPINQILLGFGVKVDKIKRHFEVTSSATKRRGMVGIDFVSKDPEKSMGYDRITVFFDEEKVEPRTIILEDETSQITVDLTRVRLNPEIDDSVFEPTWPSNAEVLEYR